MSDAMDGYRDLQEMRREDNALKRSENTPDIVGLARLGYDVRMITEYHFRIDGRLDLFPTRGRWHNLKTGKRGNYQSAAAIAVSHLGPPRRSVEGT